MHDRRSFLHSLLVLGGAASVGLPLQSLHAAADEGYVPVNPVQPTDNPAKIEVLEFFSYGCPHCNQFNPMLDRWIARQSGDVAFRRVPVTFGRAAWANLARLYYALDTLKEADRLSAGIFDALHNQRVNLFQPDSMASWLGRRGVDGKKFSETYNSFGIQSQVKRADQLAKAYKVDGVPALAIEGSYLVVAGEKQELMLTTADRLIGRIRAEKGGKRR